MGPDNSHGHFASQKTGLPIAQILLLSDDPALVTVIRSLLHLSHSPKCEVFASNSLQFAAEQALTTDCIFIDRAFGGRSPEWALREISQIVSTLSAQPPQIVLIADPNSIASDLKNIAQLARAGVDEFLLRTHMSCQTLLESAQLISAQLTNDYLDLSNRVNNSEAPSSIRDNVNCDTHDVQSFEKATENIDSRHTSDEAFLQHFNNLSRDTPQQDWTNHQISFDLDLEELFIYGDKQSPLFRRDKQLSFSAWYALLKPSSREEIETIFRRAKNYQTLPNRISCHFHSSNTIDLLGHLENISVQNNGQGRIGGIEANLVLPNKTTHNANTTANPASQLDQYVQQPENPQPEAQLSSSVAGKDTNSFNIVSSLPMACFSLDEQGLITQIINNPLSAVGQLPDLELGDDLSTLLDDQQLVDLRHNIKRTLNTGQNHHAVYSYSGNQGLRWLDTHICKLRGARGTQREILWYASDITDTRHNLQETLKRLESVDQILRLSPVLFFEKSHSGHYRQANPAFGNWTGYKPEQILGRSDAELFEGPVLRHLVALEKNLLSSPDEPALFFDSVQNIEDSKASNIEWRGLAIKHQQGKGIESLVGFGFISPTIQTQLSAQNKTTTQANIDAVNEDNLSIIKRNPSEPSDLDTARTTKLEQELEAIAHYEASGIMQIDFKSMLNSVMNYTDMALNQKFSSRQKSLLEKLDDLEATTQRAKDLLKKKTEPLPTNERAKSALQTQANSDTNADDLIDLYPIVTNIIELESQSLPANLRLTQQLDPASGKAFANHEKFSSIVSQIIASARENAVKAPNSGIKSSHITLESADLTDSCNACGDTIKGNYIELAVHTREPSISSKDLDTLVNNAKQAMTKMDSADNNSNIIALTHAQGGHSIIEHKDSTLSLKLLFKKDNHQ